MAEDARFELARYPSRSGDDVPEDKVYDSMDDLLADLDAAE